MKREEQVLLYQFRDEGKLQTIRDVLKKLHIKSRVLPEEAYAQKVGFLLGMKGFRPTEMREDGFSFPHEVMVLQNIRGKRLDEVLKQLREAGVPHIKFKAVVTPFNTLWTLRRLCETMQKEHAAMQTADGKAGNR
ncbi:MAG: DUF3783 domain-containing protein [Selenomonadaceae bacterium]|nr:DUF3783 domain-containing protein [Selenomonadaceae bacterium]